MKKKNPLTQHASIIKKRKAEKNYALRVKKQYYKQLKNSSNEQPINVSNSTETAEDQALKMRKQIDDLFEGKYDRERMEDDEDVDEELKINQIGFAT
ncbi:hypothetical protein HK098_006290 [Nowakowskiella sp. JEL0407]|nr:hypothetical protein HK098_006290 [Nowakowskiella sp. JEL0407]